MDTTAKYIKMCEKAWPIIGKPDYIPTTGRYIDGEPYEVDEFGYYWWRSEFFDRVPLYRQDQLQEMLPEMEPLHDKLSQLDNFHIWTERNLSYVDTFRASMEQLWLAAIMDWKYGKAWDDKKEEWLLE